MNKTRADRIIRIIIRILRSLDRFIGTGKYNER